MNIDLMPVIDNHCHPFPTNRIPNEWERMWSITLNNIPLEDIRNSTFFQMSIEEIRRHHGIESSASYNDIMLKIKESYLTDTQAYTAKLWQDANIKMIIADIGFPVTNKRLTKDEIDEFNYINSSISIGRINRIERITDDLLHEELPFNEFAMRFVKDTKKMIFDQNLIALKSIIAYKTGLDIKLLNDSDVRKGYYAYLADKSDGEAEKTIRDYAFLMGAQIASEHNIPLQVHTGAGDSPISNMRINNPLLLFNAINDERCKNTRIVMVHAGYPNVEYAAYLVGHYENIYLDVSSMCPFFGHAIDVKLRSIFELAPFNKVLYGSDCSGIPDLLWFSAKYFKHVLAKTLSNFIEEGVLTEEYAMKAASMVLSENVKRIYNIKLE